MKRYVRSREKATVHLGPWSVQWLVIAAVMAAMVLFPLLPAAAQGAIDAKQAPKGHFKMDSATSAVAMLAQQGQLKEAAGLAGRSNLASVDSSSLQVVIQSDQMEAAAEAVARHGGTVEAIFGALLQASVPLSGLSDLAEEPSVLYVRRPLPVTSWGGPSEGVQVTRANNWHGQNYQGEQVKVGIIDLGFAGYQSLLGSDLPGAVTAQSFRSDGDIAGGGQAHGTACAELVYDMAPEANLYLANFATEVEFGNAVRWLVNQGVSIISCSIGWVNAGPYDGTGVICDIVEDAHDDGVLWVNAMGNAAQRHWEGAFTDGNGDGYHEFDADIMWNTFAVASGDDISVFLSWNDWDNVDQDYDLYLYRQEGAEWVLVADSMNWQFGWERFQTPTEAIVLSDPGAGVYGVAVKKYSADRDVYLELYSFDNDLDLRVVGSSLVIPADAEHALSMGAFRWNTGMLEPFSGHGPTNDGRSKPDLLGPDYVTTATYGQEAFGGTSAAAPCAAGAGALVLQAYPSWGADEVKSYLKSHAVQMGVYPSSASSLGLAGEYDSGSGNLNLGDPPSPTAVELASLSVSTTPDGIKVQWETGSEQDNIGFNIYRAETQDVARAMPINQQPIPSQAPGQVLGAMYDYVDHSTAIGTLYHYWLQDMAMTGELTMHYAGAAMWEAAGQVSMVPGLLGGNLKSYQDTGNIKGMFRDNDGDSGQ